EFAQLFVSDEAAFSVLYYTPGVEIIGVNGGSFLANEFAFWQDPVIIFDATHPRENGARQTAYTTGAMYNITDEILADIIERFALGDEFVQTTNVFEAYNHFWFMIRAGIFAAVLVSALSLVLAIVVIFRIVSLEYIANAIELCIKKTLGYSLPKRNFEIIKALAICSILSVTAAIVLLGNLSEINIVAALGAAGMLLSIDIVAVLWSGWHIEKARITKILKGGAL
ncbi:MAG: hypothetical protein LBI54_06875, partial [Lachnospiraceae bacterium]|nr:hypothetical protein [Lachnospiraceae bacterium]